MEASAYPVVVQEKKQKKKNIGTGYPSAVKNKDAKVKVEQVAEGELPPTGALKEAVGTSAEDAMAKLNVGKSD